MSSSSPRRALTASRSFLSDAVTTEITDCLATGVQTRASRVEKPAAKNSIPHSLTAVFRAVAFISTCDIGSLSLAKVVSHSGATRWQLEHAFRRYLGRSPQQEIRRVRLERMMRELEKTDDLLSVVAERTGFSHVEYFSVFFKRATGETPGAYRKRLNRADKEPQIPAARSPTASIAREKYRA